jgi:uncharacterized protein
MAEETSNPAFRPGGISYLRIPAPDPHRAAEFYRAVFRWNVDADRDVPRFEDGSGHVIGHFMKNLPVAREAGVIPYIFVSRLSEAVESVMHSGGEIVEPPYPEGHLWVATFTDPAGNLIGIWQHGPMS